MRLSVLRVIIGEFLGLGCPPSCNEKRAGRRGARFRGFTMVFFTFTDPSSYRPTTGVFPYPVFHLRPLLYDGRGTSFHFVRHVVRGFLPGTLVPSDLPSFHPVTYARGRTCGSRRRFPTSQAVFGSNQFGRRFRHHYRNVRPQGRPTPPRGRPRGLRHMRVSFPRRQRLEYHPCFPRVSSPLIGNPGRRTPPPVITATGNGPPRGGAVPLVERESRRSAFVLKWAVSGVTVSLTDTRSDVLIVVHIAGRVFAPAWRTILADTHVPACVPGIRTADRRQPRTVIDAHSLAQSRVDRIFRRVSFTCVLRLS